MSKGKGKNGGNGKNVVIGSMTVLLLVAILESMGYIGNAIPLSIQMTGIQEAIMWWTFAGIAGIIALILELRR